MSFFPTLVLVGVDGTAHSRHAVMAAAELCSSTGSELHLVHVKVRSPTLRGQPMSPVTRERTDEEAQAMLEQERANAETLGVTVSGTHVRYGDAVHEAFVRAQEELGAGLLVVGERGTGSLGRRLAGAGDPGTAARRSTASVLVVREPPEAPRR